METKSSGLAIFLSFFVPGLGHLYLGKIVRSVLMMILTTALFGLSWLQFGFMSHAASSYHLARNLRVQEDPINTDYSGLEGSLEQLREERTFFLVLASMYFLWWVWGMISARRLSEKHNRSVFQLATEATKPEGKVNSE